MNDHEACCSFKTTRLLEQAGFDWFEEAGKIENCVYTPSLAVAQRWLREVKNVDVTVSRAMAWNQFYYTIEHEENRTAKVDVMSLNDDLWWFKYEDALEAGIQKYLTLLLEEKK